MIFNLSDDNPEDNTQTVTQTTQATPELPTTQTTETIDYTTIPTTTKTTEETPFDIELDNEPLLQNDSWTTEKAAKTLVLSPKQTAQLLRDYATTPAIIPDLIKNYNLTADKFYELFTFYPRLQQLFHHARKMKADVWADRVLQIADNEERDTFKKTGISTTGLKYEENVPNTVAVRRDEVRIKALQYYQERANPSRYHLKTQIESKNLNVTYHAQAPQGLQMADAGSDPNLFGDGGIPGLDS